MSALDILAFAVVCYVTGMYTTFAISLWLERKWERLEAERKLLHPSNVDYKHRNHYPV